MKLAELFPLSPEQRQTLSRNYDILRQEVDNIGREYEQKSYDELLTYLEPKVLTVTAATGITLTFVAAVYHLQKDRTICFCIDADGLPTIFGIKPSYNFYKRPDASVYY